MKKIILLLAAAGLSSGALADPQTYSSMTGTELTAICTFPGSPQNRVIQCHSFIRGVIEGQMDEWAEIVSKQGQSQKPPICLEKQTWDNIYNRVIASLVWNEKQQNLPAGLLVGNALRESFPCK